MNCLLLQHVTAHRKTELWQDWNSVTENYWPVNCMLLQHVTAHTGTELWQECNSVTGNYWPVNSMFLQQVTAHKKTELLQDCNKVTETAWPVNRSCSTLPPTREPNCDKTVTVELGTSHLWTAPVVSYHLQGNRRKDSRDRAPFLPLVLPSFQSPFLCATYSNFVCLPISAEHLPFFYPVLLLI